MSQIPFGTEAIHKQEICAAKLKRRLRLAAGFAGIIGDSATQASAFLGGDAAASGILSAAVPVLGIVLPIVLSMVALAAKTGEERWTHKAEGAFSCTY